MKSFWCHERVSGALLHMDTYDSFSELEKHEQEGKDYLIVYREADSKFCIMAPHGGGIEPGTATIADAIAGVNHTFYTFKGIKRSGNRVLHLTSARFDEPIGIKTSSSARVVVTVHGCNAVGDVVYLGGKNDGLNEKMMGALRKAGFNVKNSKIPGLRGVSLENICNRCHSRQGVQLELSRGLRERMIHHLDFRSLRKKTEVFDRFVVAVRSVLN